MFPVHTAGHSTLGFVTKHSSTTLRDKQSRIYVDKPPLLLYFLTELRHVQPPNTGGDSSLVNQISVNKRASKRKRTHRENLSKARYGCYGHWDVWRWTIVEILSAFRWRMSYHNGYSEKEVSFVNCFFFVAGSRCPWHLIAVFTASSWRSDCWLILSSKLLIPSGVQTHLQFTSLLLPIVAPRSCLPSHTSRARLPKLGLRPKSPSPPCFVSASSISAELRFPCIAWRIGQRYFFFNKNFAFAHGRRYECCYRCQSCQQCRPVSVIQLTRRRSERQILISRIVNGKRYSGLSYVLL